MNVLSWLFWTCGVHLFMCENFPSHGVHVIFSCYLGWNIFWVGWWRRCVDELQNILESLWCRWEKFKLLITNSILGIVLSSTSKIHDTIFGVVQPFKCSLLLTLYEGNYMQILAIVRLHGFKLNSNLEKLLENGPIFYGWDSKSW